MDDPDWPDFIDVYTGIFIYFGDNKKPGFALHDTHRRGNKLLHVLCYASYCTRPKSEDSTVSRLYQGR